MSIYNFMAKYQPKELFVFRAKIKDLCEEVRNKGWGVTWEFNVNPLLKYNNCTTYTECRTVDADVHEDVDENGAWNYRLDNLEVGGAYDEDSQTYNGLFMIDTSTSNTKLVSFNVNLPNLTNGYCMFRKCSGLTSWNMPLPNLTNGSYMFVDCDSLTSWDTPLPNLTNGYYMFLRCTKLTSWNTPLPNLTNGNHMFFYCQKLTSFSDDLPNLTNGEHMFYGTGLESFSSDLTNLKSGSSMFKNCSISSFNSDLPNLTVGNDMFLWCTNLTSFSSDLSSLTNGSYMFGSSTSRCTKLDLASVQNIAETIKTVSSGTIHIGISSSIQDAADLETALAAIRAKGWTVTEIYA